MVIRTLQIALLLLVTAYCATAWASGEVPQSQGLDVWAPNVQTWIVSVLTALGFPELARRVINWIKQVRALEARVDELEEWKAEAVEKIDRLEGHVEELESSAFEHFNTR